MTPHRSLILAVFLTVAPFVGRPVAADPVVDFNGGQVDYSSNITLGYKFTVAAGSSINVGALGIFDIFAATLQDSHPIGLWDSGGILLASTTITEANSNHVLSTATSFGDWRTRNLLTPVVLGSAVANTDYVVGAYYPVHNQGSSPDGFMFQTAAHPGTVSTISGVTFVEPRSQIGSGLQMPGSHQPDITGGYFGPNLFTAPVVPAVPEPTTLILFGSGLAALAGRMAWRKRRPK